MICFLWSLPVLVVAVLVASRRTSSGNASLCGLISAVVIGLTAAPSAFGPSQAILAVAQGAWLALLVGSVILAGLVFRELSSATAAEDEPAPIAVAQRREELYAACFVVGPFAEAATGFGVGQVAIAPILKRLGVTPIDAVLFGLFSQALVPWGALANGTILGAQLSGLQPATLGAHSAILIVPLLWGWLCLFWHFAARAGLPGGWRHLCTEAVATIALAGLLIGANVAFGPEVAALAALAPFIVARFVFRNGWDRRGWRRAIRLGLPYAMLIAALASTRAIQPINQALAHALSVRPLSDGPTWFPLLHPASWLLAIGAITALSTGHARAIAPAVARAWRLGRSPVLAIILSLAMAQVLFASGMATGLEHAVQVALGPAAALATPLFAGLLGFLTSSSSTTNGLLMPPQVALAQGAHLSLPWLASLQNVGAAALTMISPIRVAVGCSLVGDIKLEQRLYARAWPLGAIPLVILLAAAAALIVCSRV